MTASSASASPPSPVPLAIARSMLSLGIEASLAFWMASASDGLPSGSPPPSFAATVIARASLVNSLPRRASTIAFLCLIPAHLECPAMGAILGAHGAPRRAARRPQVVERDRVLVGVHAAPEAAMAVSAELARGGQRLERLALEHRVGPQIGERSGLEDEEAAVDPPLGPRLLVESRDPVAAVEVDHAERQLRAHDRDRAQPPVRAV